MKLSKMSLKRIWKLCGIYIIFWKAIAAHALSLHVRYEIGKRYFRIRGAVTGIAKHSDFRHVSGRASVMNTLQKSTSILKV